MGEVYLSSNCAVWYSTVLRGDLNAIKIDSSVSIGDHTVIHTVASIETGTSAAVEIMSNSIIGSNCTLCSCVIYPECYIGPNCTILPGARLEEGAVLAPGSVVPPGRLIPAGQVWGGNPVEYIRTLSHTEQFTNYTFSYSHLELSQVHKALYSYFPNAYMMKPTSKEDLDIPRDMYEIYTENDLMGTMKGTYP